VHGRIAEDSTEEETAAGAANDCGVNNGIKAKRLRSKNVEITFLIISS
jgi:hypothetical protein